MFKRRGIALIWVILVSAAIFVSILGISTKVVQEKNISLGRSASTRALAAAESGLSQILFDLRTAEVKDYQWKWISGAEPPAVTHYLSLDDIGQLTNQNIGYVLDKSDTFQPLEENSIPYVVYSAKIKKLPDSYIWAWPSEILTSKKTFYFRVYLLGTVYKDKDHTADTDVLARKAITTDIIYEASSSETSAVFNYALCSNGTTTVGGSANLYRDNGPPVKDADVYGTVGVAVNGNPTIQGTLSTTSTGTFNKGCKGYTTEQIDQVKYPTLDLDYYSGLANAFKMGNTPYDGEVPDYPDVGLLKSIITKPYYLGDETTNSSLDGIFKFYNDLMNNGGDFAPLLVGSPLWEAADKLRDLAYTIVYYHQGPMTFPSGTLPNPAELEGVLVLDGSLFLTGQPRINYDDEGNVLSDKELAILVKGDTSIKVDGGTKINCLIYSEGTTEVKCAGTFEVTGGIVSKGDIKFNAGDLYYYYPGNMLDLEVEAPTAEMEAEEGPSTWKEISYDAFNAIHE